MIMGQFLQYFYLYNVKTLCNFFYFGIFYATKIRKNPKNSHAWLMCLPIIPYG